MKIGDLTKLAKKAGAEPELKKIASEVTPIKTDTESARVREVVNSVLNSTESSEEEKLAAAEFGERISETVMNKIAGQVESNEVIQAARMVKLGYMFSKGMKLAEGEMPLDELAARAEQIASGSDQPAANAIPAEVPPPAEGSPLAEAVSAATGALADKIEELAAGSQTPAETVPPVEVPPAEDPAAAEAAAAEGSEGLSPEVLKEIEGQFPKESQDPSAIIESIINQANASPALSALVRTGDIDLASDELSKAVTSGQSEPPAGAALAPETALGAEESAAALAEELVGSAVDGQGEGGDIGGVADQLIGGADEGEVIPPAEGAEGAAGEQSIADLIASLEGSQGSEPVVNPGEIEVPPAEAGGADLEELIAALSQAGAGTDGDGGEGEVVPPVEGEDAEDGDVAEAIGKKKKKEEK